MNITNHTAKPYFERLPRYALPAAQAAWDKAKARNFGTLAIYTGFCRDMDEVGYEKPSKPVMTDWIGQIQVGLIPRPGSKDDAWSALADTTEEAVKADLSDDASPVADQEKLRAAVEAITGEPSPIFSDAASSKPFFTPEFPAETAPIEPMTDALRMVSQKMLDELVAEFEANARRHATTLVVGILRDLAIEMERAA